MRTTITHGKLRYQQKNSPVWGITSTSKMRVLPPIPRPERTLTNNLLAAIMGNAEILRADIGTDAQELAEATDEIRRAARRGAELTNHLLAFSRQQPLQPKAIELSSLISDMTALLRRSLGETIEIRTIVQSGLWKPLADPGQVENALLNLAINARQAMSQGGELTIEAQNAELDTDLAVAHPAAGSGQYVRLSITDTGIGMSPEVMQHAFEPFFTTKDVGQGSGLGLSMVYGFARQLGGHVTIESAPGQGTTVSLFLPRAEETAASEESVVEPERPGARGESILVIEDDPHLSKLVVKQLRRLGYAVVEAADGNAALDAIAGQLGIDLLLSDMVLPGGKSGPAVAADAKRRQPDLKVLFMSGYADDIRAPLKILLFRASSI